jgi:hypothetical protein
MREKKKKKKRGQLRSALMEYDGISFDREDFSGVSVTCYTRRLIQAQKCLPWGKSIHTTVHTYLLTNHGLTASMISSESRNLFIFIYFPEG